MKDEDLGRLLVRSVGRSLAEREMQTPDTTQNNGRGRECWCFDETHPVCCACSLVKLLPPMSLTTSSRCGCGIERTTDSTISTQCGDFVRPATPESLAVKHTVKPKADEVCPICGGRTERGHPGIEVR